MPNIHSKKIWVLTLALSALLIQNVWASSFLFTVPILEQSKIATLSDEELQNAYVEVMVEVDAVKTFYSKGGFTPKEYESYKDILRYRIHLGMEFQKRKLEMPSVTPVIP